MKRIFSFIVFIFLFYGFAEGQYQFEFGIDTYEDNVVWAGAIDNEGAVVLVGGIGQYNNSDGYIIKIYPDGSYIDKRFNMKDTVSLFKTIEVLENGNYFILGKYSTDGNYVAGKYLWILVLDEELNVITRKSYKVREPYVGFGGRMESVVDNEGNVVMTGMALDDGKDGKTQYSDFAFYKFTPSGDTILSKYYSYIWNEIPFELTKVPNTDNFLLIEMSTVLNNHMESMFLDPDLNILNIINWPYYICMDGLDVSSDYWSSDTSFIVSGTGVNDTDFYIKTVLIDTAVTVQKLLSLNKADTFDFAAWIHSMSGANDSTIYIGGFQSYNYPFVLDPSIIELYVVDKDLNLLGYKQFGGDVNYELWGIIATPDDGCLLYGVSFTNDTVIERDLHFWKVLRDDINITVNVSRTEQTGDGILLYPNPVGEKLNILLPEKRNWKDLTLTIHSVSGKKVFTKKITQSGNHLELYTENLNKGIYILKITGTNENIFSGKFIKN